MSSEIVPGFDSMALAERAWHGYGTVVGSNMSYAEALAIADLDWTARLAPITTITPNGVVEVDTHRATYRSDTGAVLGVVGADYQPHQPAELLELARLTIDAAPTDAHVEVVGSLRAGRTVFLTIALPDDIDIAGDVHLPRLVWVTSMDGTIGHPGRVHLHPSRLRQHDPGQLPQRPHQLGRPPHLQPDRPGRRRPPRPGSSCSAPPRRSAPKSKPSPARPITDPQVEQVLTGLWPDHPDATTRTRAGAARRRDAVRTMYRSDPRVTGWHGTAYGLVQAASTWEQWNAPRRGDRGEQVLTGVLTGGRVPRPLTSPNDSPPWPDPGRPGRRHHTPVAASRAGDADGAARRAGDVKRLRRRRQAPRSSGPSPAG